jgi:archaellum component FlaF (FlaF/FlaG flagellin family)
MGTLIFIGILFTAVIPMALVMKQADNFYAEKVYEMKNRDDERSKENVFVSAYPGASTTIYVKVENNGNVPVKIVRVWINDESFSVDTSLVSNSYQTLGLFSISIVSGESVQVKAVSERGNLFYSISGPLLYSNGQWFTVSLGVCVVIYNPKGGQFKIVLRNNTAPVWSETIYESHSQEWQDVIASHPVEDSGSYSVIIYEKKGSNWKELSGSPIPVEITWPSGPPFIMVWISP